MERERVEGEGGEGEGDYKRLRLLKHTVVFSVWSRWKNKVNYNFQSTDLQTIIGNGLVECGSATAAQGTKGKSDRGERRSCASPVMHEKARGAL